MVLNSEKEIEATDDIGQTQSVGKVDEKETTENGTLSQTISAAPIGEEESQEKSTQEEPSQGEASQGEPSQGEALNEDSLSEDVILPHEAVEEKEEDYDTDLEMEDKQTVVRSYRNMTDEDIYIKSCEQLGVVPATYFLNHLHKEVMNIGHHGLGPRGTRAIAVPLVVNTSILELNIEDNYIKAEGMQDIGDMLVENCYITSLNLGGNKLASAGARLLCKMLQDNTSLRHLNVSRNDFKDNDGQYFAEALKLNFRLKNLDISGNAFCEIGGEWLGQGIAFNEAIETLNLSWNHLRLKGAMAICAGMKSNITIKLLDLSWNGFANAGAMAMGEALKTNNTLTWLDLSNNRIGEKGAVMLAKGLEINEYLRTLKIGDNPIGKQGALALIRAVIKNQKSALEELDLKGVEVNTEFVELAKTLQIRAGTHAPNRTSFSYTTNRRESMLNDDKGLEGKQDPMLLLQSFLQEKRLRLVDLFKNFDKDTSWKISPREFKKGIVNAGIPLSKRQLRRLVDSLDIDVDGQVDYRELTTGQKTALVRRREMLRKEAIAKKKEKQEGDKFLSVWQEALRATKSPTTSPTPSPRLTPLHSQSFVKSQQVDKGRRKDFVDVALTLPPGRENSLLRSQSKSSMSARENKFLKINMETSLRSKSLTNIHDLSLQPFKEDAIEISIPVPVPKVPQLGTTTKIPSRLSANSGYKSMLKIRRTGGIPNSRKIT